MNYRVRGSVRRVVVHQGEVYALALLATIRYVVNLRGGITMDEAFYAQAGLSMFEGYMYGNPTHMHAPLAKYFIGFSQVLFGPTEVAIRLPIALFGVASIVATYWVGRYVFGRLAGLIAAGLIAAIPVYNYYATMAMLDVPLALFVLLGFATTVWWHRNSSSSRPPAALGALTVFAGATKVQGALYVFGILAIVGWMAGVEHRERWQMIVTNYAVGSAVTFAVVYLPFAFSPAPTYYGGANPPAIAQSLFSIPWIGSIGFAFAASIVHNLSHLDDGHRVVVLGQTYYRPPAWVFLFWLGKYGGIPYLVGLTTSITAVIGRFGDRGVRIGFAGLMIFPLVVHTLLSVKLDRYLVPLYPLLAVAAGAGFVFLARLLLQVCSNGPTFHRFSTRQITMVALALLLVLSLFPPTFATTVSENPIRTDSGIDDGADIIVDYAEQQEDMTAVVSNPLPYRWYLGEHQVGRFTKDVHDPKTFRVENTSITLVGTKYDDIETVLYRRSPCLVVVSDSWLRSRNDTDATHQYLRDLHVVESYSRVRVYEGCSASG